MEGNDASTQIALLRCLPSPRQLITSHPASWLPLAPPFCLLWVLCCTLVSLGGDLVVPETGRLWGTESSRVQPLPEQVNCTCVLTLTTLSLQGKNTVEETQCWDHHRGPDPHARVSVCPRKFLGRWVLEKEGQFIREEQREVSGVLYAFEGLDRAVCEWDHCGDCKAWVRKERNCKWRGHGVI